MKITDFLNNKEHSLVSFEVLPPKRGETIDSLFYHLDRLMEFNPSFIDVTYHREEYIYKIIDGIKERFITKKRPGTVGICAAIQNKYKVNTVPHIICGGFTQQETEEALIDLNFLGMKNILLLRGDFMKTENKFIPTPQGHRYATDLLKQVVQMNQGKYLYDEIVNATPTNFCIGVAAYPEKHFESKNAQEDIALLKKKQDLGADYAVTQMFFDNEKYFSYLKKCREQNIDIPIIPGLKPITTRKQINILPNIFHTKLPDILVKEIKRCKNDLAVKQVGIEWCIQQSKDLFERGVPIIHYYTMSKSSPMCEILKAVL